MARITSDCGEMRSLSINARRYALVPDLVVLPGAATPQHGLPSNTMALITSDCGAMRSLGSKWPQSTRIVCPSGGGPHQIGSPEAVVYVDRRCGEAVMVRTSDLPALLALLVQQEAARESRGQSRAGSRRAGRGRQPRGLQQAEGQARGQRLLCRRLSWDVGATRCCGF